jgi:hypothetical protein
MFRTVLAVAALAAAPVFAQSTPSPDGAEAYFVALEDGDTVSSPVTVHFGLRGMGVAPAGVDMPNTGHHHLLINRPAFGEADVGFGLPADDNHRHFGGGQTEVTLDLPPGTHTLQLVLADMNHVPHDPPVTSEQISITVE